jgi:hypothetical protein
MTARPSGDCDDGGVATVPDFITHYYLADRRPFLNLSDLDDRVIDSGLGLCRRPPDRRTRPSGRTMQLNLAFERSLEQGPSVVNSAGTFVQD